MARRMKEQAFAHVELSSIRENPSDAARHSAEGVDLLAKSISAYGLQNAIRVRKILGTENKFEIVHGTGRYLAHKHLMQRDAPNGDTPWNSIQCIIEEEGDSSLDPGKRSSEENIRRRDWPTERVLFAQLKENGRSRQQIQEEFGLCSSAVRSITAAGECLIEAGLDGRSMCQFAGKLRRQDFVDHVVPLRISLNGGPARKGIKGFTSIDRAAYDYSEVKECVDLLLRDELSRKDLPAYSRGIRNRKQTPPQMSLPDVFDRVPTHLQMMSHVQHGHVSGKLKHVTLERSGILRSGSAKGTFTWRTTPHRRHSTRGINHSTRVGRRPIGRVIQVLLTVPFFFTLRLPHAQH